MFASLGSSAWAQTAPLRVTAKPITGVPGAVRGSAGSREAKLRVSLQSLSAKPLEGVETRWTFVVEDDSFAPPYRTFADGSKTVDLKALGRVEFDTEIVEVSRERYGPKLKGYWVQVTCEGKTVFEEHNPESVRKYLEQRRKDAEKNTDRDR